MEELLNQFTQFAQENAYLAYGFLFISAYVENVFPPIPGDTVTLIGAYFVGKGNLNFMWVLTTTTLGSIAGFMTLFLGAYWVEWKVIEKYRFNWIQKTHIDKVQNWFNKFGFGIILFNRFLSGVRSVISITAGLSKLNIFRVLILSSIGAFIWNGLIIFAGSSIGKNWEEILHYIKIYNKVIMITLGIIGVSFLFHQFFIKKKKNNVQP